jgi:hypothetical protein
LKPDLRDILKVAKRDSDKNRKFWRAKNPTNFQLTDTDYKLQERTFVMKKHLQLLARQKQ